MVRIQMNSLPLSLLSVLFCILCIYFSWFHFKCMHASICIVQLVVCTLHTQHIAKTFTSTTIIGDLFDLTSLPVCSFLRMLRFEQSNYHTLLMGGRKNGSSQFLFRKRFMLSQKCTMVREESESATNEREIQRHRQREGGGRVLRISVRLIATYLNHSTNILHE